MDIYEIKHEVPYNKGKVGFDFEDYGLNRSGIRAKKMWGGGIRFLWFPDKL